MKYILTSILAVTLAISFSSEASPGGPPSLGCDDIFPDCATKPELQAAYDDLQGQIDDIELTPGPQGEQGIQGVAGNDGVGIDGQDGADGADGQDADMTLVDANTDGVAANAAAIAINSADIGSNSQGISDNSQAITDVESDSVDRDNQLAGGISANTAAIGVNAGGIAGNSNAIAAVESDSIGRDNALASGIAQNRSLINDNAEEIEWLKGEVADVRDEMRDGLSQVAATGIIPDAEPGKFGVGIGCASYKSNDNCALGLAWTANDGRYKLKAAATEDVVSIGGMINF